MRPLRTQVAAEFFGECGDEADGSLHVGVAESPEKPEDALGGRIAAAGFFLGVDECGTEAAHHLQGLGIEHPRIEQGLKLVGAKTFLDRIDDAGLTPRLTEMGGTERDG